MTYSQSIKSGKQETNKLKLKMSKNGLIAYDRETATTLRLTKDETNKLTTKNVNFSKFDEVCEVAHLEISNSCNMKCKYCYVGKKKEKELTTDQWDGIFHNLSQYGIFQVSFGGGEPTLRKDLFDLAERVNYRGMNLAMTTNGKILPKLDPTKLKKYFKQINVSWHENPEIFESALDFLSLNDIPIGINYCFSRRMAKDNDMIKFLAEHYGAEILYLVYKPVIGDYKNQIPNEEVYRVAKQASEEGLRVGVDGPCVNKCLMKKKFIDVDSMGNVYPCSFVRKPMGNLLKTNFKEIWKNRGNQEECPFVKLEERND